MKQKLQLALVSGMLFLSANSFGQTAHTYLDIKVNVVSTNLYYGEANSSLDKYKKSARGIQAGDAAFQGKARTRADLALKALWYFHDQAGRDSRPLTRLQHQIRIDCSTKVHAGRARRFVSGQGKAVSVGQAEDAKHRL